MCGGGWVGVDCVGIVSGGYWGAFLLSGVPASPLRRACGAAYRGHRSLPRASVPTHPSQNAHNATYRGPRITSSLSLWGSLAGTPVTSPSQCPHSPLSERTQRDLPGTPVSLGVTLGSDQSDFAGKLDKFECSRDPGGLGCYHGQRSA